MTGTCETGTIAEAWYFAYDGDGVRVSTAHDQSGNISISAYYFGGAYEATGTGTLNGDKSVATFTIVSKKKYYSFGGVSIMREYNNTTTPETSTLSYMLTDHLGSVVAITDANGVLKKQMRYLPFGQLRDGIPQPTLGENETPPNTDFGYTGQRALDSGMGGIMDYKARFYSPYINRFLQPDSIIPNAGNPQNFNRYSYVGNNPVNFNDPTGHKPQGPKGYWQCRDSEDSTHCRAKGVTPSPNPSSTPTTELPTGDDWQTDDKIDKMISDLESTYAIDLVGGWDVNELTILSNALSLAATNAGGVDNLNDIFLDGVRAGTWGDKLIINNTPGNTSPCSSGGFACWDTDENTIFLSDYIFTDAYQKTRQHRSNTPLGAAETIVHEVVHVFADARPSMVGLFVGFLDNPTPFWKTMTNCTDLCLYEENMAALLARYIVTGKVSSPNQFDYVTSIQHYWYAWP